MAADGRGRPRPVLRGAHERCRPCPVPIPGGLALAPRAGAAQPDRPRLLGADAAAHSAVAATCPHLSSLSPRATRRYHPRQEPDAVMPLVRICGGGYGQSSSLLRPTRDPHAHRSGFPVRPRVVRNCRQRHRPAGRRRHRSRGADRGGGATRSCRPPGRVRGRWPRRRDSPAPTRMRVVSRCRSRGRRSVSRGYRPARRNRRSGPARWPRSLAWTRSTGCASISRGDIGRSSSTTSPRAQARSSRR